MKQSENSQSTSQSEGVQLPLKGFRVKVESPKKGWHMWHEGMGDGRVRVHMTKIAK